MARAVTVVLNVGSLPTLLGAWRFLGGYNVPRYVGSLPTFLAQNVGHLPTCVGHLPTLARLTMWSDQGKHPLFWCRKTLKDSNDERQGKTRPTSLLQPFVSAQPQGPQRDVGHVASPASLKQGGEQW